MRIVGVRAGLILALCLLAGSVGAAQARTLKWQGECVAVN